MIEAEVRQLTQAIEVIQERALAFGLDGFPMRYEICPADIIYTFGAYGMPIRFSHWSFGKAFHRMKTRYEFNLSRIYELVINSDPCHAFLLDSNSLLQNKVIAAHVLAHSDFFKHNYRFASTSRTMPETMAVHARRLRRYEMRYGREEVESVLDAAIALQEQIDPHIRTGSSSEYGPSDGLSQPETDSRPSRRPSPYDDLWQLDDANRLDRPNPRAGASPASEPKYDERRGDEPPRDLLLYMMQHGRHLADWQRDILGIVRAEMLYFWPQLETKILNEGWATYWHSRIMNSLDLTEAESIDFARMHASVLAPGRLHANPYRVGYELLRSIEKRWNEPTEQERARYGRAGNEGMQKLFDVRETETDLSLLRNYLTQDLVAELDLYVYRREENEWVVADNEWETVRDELVRQLTNGGIPVIAIVDGDYRRNGELMLQHRYEGVELDLRYLERTLPYVHRLWGRPVHLETVVEGQAATFSCAGGGVVRE